MGPRLCAATLRRRLHCSARRGLEDCDGDPKQSRDGSFVGGAGSDRDVPQPNHVFAKEIGGDQA